MTAWIVNGSSSSSQMWICNLLQGGQGDGDYWNYGDGDDDDDDNDDDNDDYDDDYDDDDDDDDDDDLPSPMCDISICQY